MRLSRQFKLGKKAGFQLIAEGFNLANRTNFASVNNVVGLGLPTAVGGVGSITFHVKGTSAVGPSQALGFTSAFPSAKSSWACGSRFSGPGTY